MIMRIRLLCLIIIIKSEVWTIWHCLGHEIKVCVQCLFISLLIHALALRYQRPSDRNRKTSIQHFRVGSISNRFWPVVLCYLGTCRLFGADTMPIASSRTNLAQMCADSSPHPLMTLLIHDDVIKWKRYWPFVWGIHRWPVNSPRKGQWRGALMFSLICTGINGSANNREAGDLRRHPTHYDVTVMA